MVFLSVYYKIMNNDYFSHVHLTHPPTRKWHINSNGSTVHEEQKEKKNKVNIFFHAETQLKIIHLLNFLAYVAS